MQFLDILMSFIYVCAWFLQPFQVIATDQGKRPRTSSEPANVLIRVSRNERAPVFLNEDRYTKDINRNQATNAEIVTVRATDEDSKVSVEKIGSN